MSDCPERDRLVRQVERHDTGLSDVEWLICCETQKQKEIKNDAQALEASERRIEDLRSDKDSARQKLDEVHQLLTDHLRRHKC